MDGNPDVWEGLCGSCNEWVALVSSKKKGTTWFRHAYKVSHEQYFQHVRQTTDSLCQCHTHPKIKDAPKRRRESSHTRALGASTMAKPKIETPITPQMTPSNSVTNTPTPGSLQQQQQQLQQQRNTISPLEGLSTMI
jgi:hypothetical protein